MNVHFCIVPISIVGNQVAPIEGGALNGTAETLTSTTSSQQTNISPTAAHRSDNASNYAWCVTIMDATGDLYVKTGVPAVTVTPPTGRPALARVPKYILCEKFGEKLAFINV